MTLDNQHEERVRGAFAALVDATPLGVEFDELSHVSPTASVDVETSAGRRRGWLVAVGTAAAVLVLVGGVAWLFPVDDSTESASVSASVSPAGSWERFRHDEAVFGGEGTQLMEGVTVGGPGLVAVGSDGSNAAVWTYGDGTTWKRVPHDEAVFGGPNTQRILSVVAAGPGFVAVGADGSETGRHWVAAVWTSVDGIAWSRVPHNEEVFGGVESQAMASVTVGGPGLVAVGGPGHSWEEGGDAVVWTSVDGITWSRVPHDEEVFGGARVQWMSAVTAGGPGLVAVGYDSQGSVHNDSDAAVWTSVDGIRWSRVPHDEATLGGQRFQDMADVTAGGPGLVAVGSDQPGDDIPEGPSSDAAVWTSVDGITWSRVPHDESVFAGTGGQRMAAVIATDSGLVAVGSDGGGYDTRADAAVWTSVDGITWSRVPHDESLFGGARMSSVTVAGPSLVAVGSDWLGDDADVAAVVWVRQIDG